jgi:hypothetical protein
MASSLEDANIVSATIDPSEKAVVGHAVQSFVAIKRQRLVATQVYCRRVLCVGKAPSIP